MRDPNSDSDAEVLDALAQYLRTTRAIIAAQRAKLAETEKVFKDAIDGLDDICGDLQGSADKLRRESEDNAASSLADQRIAERKEA